MFLKVYCLCYFFVCKLNADRDGNPFFLYIIVTVYNCDNFYRKRFNSGMYTKV